MIKKIFIVICAFLGLSCGSEKPKDLKGKVEIKLNQALKKFEPTNNAFLLSIFHNDTCIVQIAHRSFIDITRHQDNSFGFALNLTFDQTFESEIENLKNFKQMDISNQFKYYEWDGIPCYAIDLDKDAEKASMIVADILKDLYGIDDNSKVEIELLDQGRI